jgi:hypothetical protein
MARPPGRGETRGLFFDILIQCNRQDAEPAVCDCGIPTLRFQSGADEARGKMDEVQLREQVLSQVKLGKEGLRGVRS